MSSVTARPLARLVGLHGGQAPLPRAAMGHVAQKPHLRVAHRKREVTLQPLLQVGEKRRGPVRAAPGGEPISKPDARHHDAQVHAELPLRVAGELEAEIALHLGDAALQKLPVVRVDRPEQRRQDAPAHCGGGKREQHGHDEAPDGPFGALDRDLAPDGQREPAHLEHALPPAQIGLDLLLVAEHAPRQALGGMGPRMACQRDHLLAQPLVARVHLGLALFEQPHKAVLLVGHEREPQAGAALPAHPRGKSLMFEKGVEGLHVSADRAIGAAEPSSVIGGRPVIAGLEQRPQKRPLSTVHRSSSHASGKRERVSPR